MRDSLAALAKQQVADRTVGDKCGLNKSKSQPNLGCSEIREAACERLKTNYKAVLRKAAWDEIVHFNMHRFHSS